MENSLTTFSDTNIAVMKKTVAIDASDAEFFMFAHICKKYNLDPFAKEAWFIKYGGKPTIMASRDGYLKIAQSDKDFDGIQSSAVYKDDEIDFDFGNQSIKHKINTKSIEGKPIGAWSMCYHKNRKPVMVFVRFSEYVKTSPIWSQYPSAMIMKVAEVIALKKQFGINGLVTQEELGFDMPEVKREMAGDVLIGKLKTALKGTTDEEKLIEYNKLIESGTIYADWKIPKEEASNALIKLLKQ